MTTPAVTTTAQTAPASSLDAVDAVARFTVAFDSRDVDAIMATMTPDCIFEDTAPPDGARHVGAGNRVVVRWRYTWKDGHVRGVDLFTIRDGLVAEKLAYVKG
jgi:hypothetical protein